MVADDLLKDTVARWWMVNFQRSSGINFRDHHNNGLTRRPKGLELGGYQRLDVFKCECSCSAQVKGTVCVCV